MSLNGVSDKLWQNRIPEALQCKSCKTPTCKTGTCYIKGLDLSPKGKIFVILL